MKSARFVHKPLANLVKGLESDEGLSAEEIREEMVKKGYDPEGLAHRLQAIADAASKDARLAWMKIGEAIQARADSTFQGVRSWAEKTAAEVDKAFTDVLEGHYGAAAKMELQSAFRNKGAGELSKDNKAAFLDSIDALRKLADNGTKEHLE